MSNNVLSTVLVLGAATGVLAQDRPADRLNGPPLQSRYAESLGDPAATAAPAVDAAEPGFRQTRRGRRPVRAMKRGARGALLGETSQGTYELPAENPSYDGLAQAKSVEGYAHFPGRLFVQGPREDSPVEPEDVNQGQLGDCYFLASLAAVANTNPELIQGMVQDRGDGTYVVRLFDQPYTWALEVPQVLFGLDNPGTATFRDVVVDAEFPSNQWGGPAFSRGRGVGADKELWVMLAEKAFAVLKGDYEEIGEGGRPAFALTAITGSPVEVHPLNFRSGEAVGQILDEALADGRPIVLSSDPAAPWAEDGHRHPGNVVPNHAYAVLRAEDGGYVIYNPWGHSHPDSPMTAEQVAEHFRAISVGGA